LLGTSAGPTGPGDSCGTGPGDCSICDGSTGEASGTGSLVWALKLAFTASHNTMPVILAKRFVLVLEPGRRTVGVLNPAENALSELHPRNGLMVLIR